MALLCMLAGLRFGPHLQLACKLRSRTTSCADRAPGRQALRHGGDCASCGAAAGAAWWRMHRSFYSRCRNCMARVADPPQWAAGTAADCGARLACRLRSVLCWRADLSIVKEMLAKTGVRQVPASTPQCRPSRRGAACGGVLPGPTARGNVSPLRGSYEPSQHSVHRNPGLVGIGVVGTGRAPAACDDAFGLRPAFQHRGPGHRFRPGPAQLQGQAGVAPGRAQ
ncbi:hypothetical protein CBM2623_B110060 [Cupriavidus taiwanensis]|nr:hypothetical protein CBM2608_B120061 [Cupriavidus taiwanensis]SPA32003.1 hypothetical protein CBM2623_B110060 [Cupriavidus taiwanensis]